MTAYINKKKHCGESKRMLFGKGEIFLDALFREVGIFYNIVNKSLAIYLSFVNISTCRYQFFVKKITAVKE